MRLLVTTISELKFFRSAQASAQKTMRQLDTQIEGYKARRKAAVKERKQAESDHEYELARQAVDKIEFAGEDFELLLAAAPEVRAPRDKEHSMNRMKAMMRARDRGSS